MRNQDFYTQLLGVKPPWYVSKVDLQLSAGEVHIFLELDPLVQLVCPICGRTVPGYDKRERRWRHLDTFQYKTVLIAEVPRVQCPHDGIHQVPVPWAASQSRFTTMFEALAIDWLHEASVSAVSRLLGCSWDELDGIMQRAVTRGLQRREPPSPQHLGVDETSFQKRHEYVTVVVDHTRGHVLYVADGRGQASLDAFYETLDQDQLDRIASVTMDMHAPYIQSTLTHVPAATRKIAFDKFHVAKHLGEGVDKVRRQEHRALQKAGDERLKHTKYLWLKNPEHMSQTLWQSFRALRQSSLHTARAWALKEMAMTLWAYVSRGWAEKSWRQWLAWVQRCRLEPMVKVGRTIRNHLWGIINAVILKITNARSEGMNAKIQKLKVWACGYRNRQRFRRAILFHLGGLNLYPEGIKRSSGSIV